MGMFYPTEWMYLLVSSLWVPWVFQTCGAFSGLRCNWSGKKAKVFPGKRAGLSGGATRWGSPVRSRLGHPSLPYPGARETRIGTPDGSTPIWPRFWELVDSSRGVGPEVGSVCVVSALTKRSAVIRRICYQFLLCRCPAPRAPPVAKLRKCAQPAGIWATDSKARQNLCVCARVSV